jgi:hypothetical protein
MTAPAHNAAATITPRNAKDRPESKERGFAGVRSRFAGDFIARLCLAKADSLRLKIPTGIDRVAINAAPQLFRMLAARIMRRK